MQNKPLENLNTSTKSAISTKTRRRLLLALGGVSATAYLPSQWQKPLIDSIVVPAHAQATGPAQGETTTTTQEPLETVFSDRAAKIDIIFDDRSFGLNPIKSKESWYAKALSLGVSNAKAQSESEIMDGKIKFTTSPDQLLLTKVELSFNFVINIYYSYSSGSLELQTEVPLTNNCFPDPDAKLTITSFDGNTLKYTINHPEFSGSGTATADKVSINTECSPEFPVDP